MKVFVYGTLKRGYWNHRLLEKSKFVGEGTISGYELYDLGSYPGIIPGEKKDEVDGELYEIDNETLIRLDRLEGEGFLYLRKEVEVDINGHMEKVLIYVYNRKVKGAKKLKREWRRSA